MHVYTSVTVNYIPKARILAQSVKKFHPEATFHLVLSDAIPAWFDLSQEPFDALIHIADLGIANLDSWIFKHTLVELCTAVKGRACQYIIDTNQADKVIYLDPDIVIFSRLDSILDKLNEFSILLTPHQTVPETNEETIADNEICSLKHGVFNLGFLAIHATDHGRAFVDWWTARLIDFCYDDIAAGLFTDQRWVDLAPCLFAGLHVLREPIYNVCTWNLSNRLVTGSLESGIFVNDLPLCFYHFSGFDSGSQEIMLDKYGKKSPVLKKLRNWYLDQCDTAGQQEYGTTPCRYNSFDNNEPVTRSHRLLYRSRQDLIDYFPNPFETGNVNKSYYHWFRSNADVDFGDCGSDIETPEMLRDALVRAHAELSSIKNSRTWRLLLMLRQLIHPLRG